jgi:hypothetical protein
VKKSQGKSQDHEVEYFLYSDFDHLYACIGSEASKGIFRITEMDAPAPQWEFLAPRSPAWDSIHERIYYTPRTDRVPPDELPPNIPPIPPVPEGPFPPHEHYYTPKDPIPRSRYPRVAEYIAERGEEPVTVYPVLAEDLWESKYGDGIFLYLKTAFFSKAEAKRFAEEHTTEETEFSIETMKIGLNGHTFSFPAFRLAASANYTPEKVLGILEATGSEEPSED